MSFSALKKRKNNLESLKNKMQSNSGGQQSYDDDRYWTLERDKAGNGYAVIRFLDVSKADQEKAGDSEVAPWAHYYTHAFKNEQGRWFFDNCLTSIGSNCPVCEANSELWNSGVDANKEVARQRKRKEHYVTNIYVVKDSANPQNEGKVFLYKFGPSIFDKIKDAMTPEFEDEVGFNPFDFWEGANFKLKARMSDGYVKYDKSEFDSQGPLLDDDSEMESVWSKSYALHEITDPSNFRSYDELKSKLNKIIGATQPKIVESAPVAEVNSVPFSSDDDDDDDDSLEYFRSKLADD